MDRRETDLQDALLKLHQRWKTELGYSAEFFRQMFIKTKSKRYKGPLGAVRHVLHAAEKTAVWSRLEREGRPDLTVENLILQDEWLPLLSPDDVAAAKRNLARFITAK